ncbi:hypothetical protein EG329_005607 [Mollisiaceae sp. DMI_Dod_QoI]|nr:hypothetical protein EG329_005607 [Helotiales sp. DMI_Dod_QoI]
MRNSGNISLIFLVSIVATVRSWSTTSYANSTKASTSATSTITTPPIYCGTCAVYYEVHAHVWWSLILTDYIATLVYTLNKAGSTIGSSLKSPANATVIPGNKNVTAYANGGPVEYTTLNTVADAEFITLVQTNLITLNGTLNGYGVSTVHVNSSLTGTAQTSCEFSYYGPNPTITTILPGLPAMTEYIYTTAIPFDASFNMSQANAYGLSILASEVATYLHLTVSQCSAYGGGTGTLKVGVTALTSSSTVYAVEEISTSSSSPPRSTATTTSATPTQSATKSTVTPTPTTQPTYSPTTIPETTGSSSTTAGVTTPTPSSGPSTPIGSQFTTTVIYTTTGPSGPSLISKVETITPPLFPSQTLLTQASGTTNPIASSFTTTLIYTTTGSLGSSEIAILKTIALSSALSPTSSVTTIIYTTTGPSGPSTITTVATISGPYITTFAEITTGPSGLETLSETSTIPIGSYILSILGITGSATASGLVPTASSTSSSLLPAPFTSSASKSHLKMWDLGLGLGFLGILFVF